jgi:hypothetical protein
MSCRVLEMTSVGGRANISRTDRNIGTMIRHLLRFLQNGSLSMRVEFVASLLMLQHEQLLGGGQKVGHPPLREFCQPQLFLKNFPNRRHAGQEALRKYFSAGQKTLLKKCRKLQPQGQARPPGARSVLTGEVAVSKFMGQILIWHWPYASVPSLVTSS